MWQNTCQTGLNVAILMAWVNDQCPSPGRLGHALRITRSLWLSSSIETTKIQLRDECWSFNATADAGTIPAAHLGAASVRCTSPSFKQQYFLTKQPLNTPDVIQNWTYLTAEFFLFIILRFFPLQMFWLAALTWCRVFICRYFYVSHTLHTCTSILILSALHFLHREHDSSY